jgi:Na+/H+ antiporter NhaD/arsenite permease-like protein
MQLAPAEHIAAAALGKGGLVTLLFLSSLQQGLLETASQVLTAVELHFLGRGLQHLLLLEQLQLARRWMSPVKQPHQQPQPPAAVAPCRAWRQMQLLVLSLVVLLLLILVVVVLWVHSHPPEAQALVKALKVGCFLAA